MRPARCSALLAAAMLTVGCSSEHGAGLRHATASGSPRPDPVLLEQQGRRFAQAGDLVRAEQYLAAALNAGADEARVVPELLRVCVDSQHYQLATEYVEVALAKHPADAHLRFLAGALYLSVGERARARDHLERAARELPDDAELQFSVACFFRDEMTDLAAADGYFREYLRLAPTGPHADEARGSLLERVQ